MRGHETIDHTADMGIRGWGRDPGEAFEEIAAAMFEIMADTEGVPATETVSIVCGAGDLKALLLEYLNALIARCDVRGMVPIRVTVGRLEKSGEEWVLEAQASGAPVAELRDRLLTEVKAATYYGVIVRELESGTWETRCVVDL